jgi:hypothetical protein
MSDGPIWTPDATAMMEKVPGFVRGMAKTMVESYAVEKGEKEITPDLIKEARAKVGM